MTAEISDNLGLRAVELYYRPIKEISNGSVAFYQSQTRLNSEKFGVLLPDAYREVSEMSPQCLSLFSLEFTQALEAIAKFIEKEKSFAWLSVYMPVWFLKEKRAELKLIEQCEKFGVPTNRLCFQLSEKLLAEKDGAAATAIDNLRKRGFHFLLEDFGGDVCPMMRLADFPVDYVMLSPEVANHIGKNERADNAVKSILGFVSDLGCEPVADGVVNSKQAEMFYAFECSYCAGSLAGNYETEKRICRKKDND